MCLIVLIAALHWYLQGLEIMFLPIFVVFLTESQDALAKEGWKQCLCAFPSSAVIQQQAFKRKVLNGAS